MRANLRLYQLTEKKEYTKPSNPTKESE